MDPEFNNYYVVDNKRNSEIAKEVDMISELRYMINK